MIFLLLRSTLGIAQKRVHTIVDTRTIMEAFLLIKKLQHAKQIQH